MIVRPLSALFLLAVSAASLSAQTLELRSGEVVIGRVLEVDDHTVRVEVTFPDVSARSIARADIEPRSIYALLSARINQADARSHLELAVTCRELGLFALAIAEAWEAGRRDPTLRPTVDKMIPELRGQIAAEVLRQAESDFADGRLGAARLAAEVVMRDYDDTPAARGAKRLTERVAARVGPAPRVATAKEAEKLVAEARKDLERTEKDTATPAHGSVRDQRDLERAVVRLEKIWAKIGDLLVPVADATSATVTTSPATPADHLSSMQAELRERLTAAYLSLGSIYLQRRALPDAEEWCNKACALDPKNAHLHRLHERILQAKIVGGWGN
jgi:hypothetical protein